MEDEDAEMARAMATSEREYVRQGAEPSPPEVPGTTHTGTVLGRNADVHGGVGVARVDMLTCEIAHGVREIITCCITFNF